MFDLCKIVRYSFYLIICIMITPFIASNSLSQPFMMSESQKSALELQLTSTPSIYNDTRTNVSLIKSIIGDGGQLKFQYDIKTPPVNRFQFVLALDSSGSVGREGDQKQAAAIIYAVPNFINDTIDLYSDEKIFNVSIISWDDDIDFAYPEDSSLAIIKDLPAKMGRIFGAIDDNQFLYRSSPYDHTNISEAIRASIAILDKNPPDEYYQLRTSQFIILVVGASEYIQCNEDLIEEARRKGYNIYIIGIGLNEIEPNEMYSHLVNICGERERINTIRPIHEDLEEELLRQLNKALYNAIYEPVAQNISINEVLFDYIHPETEATVEVLKTQDIFKTNIDINSENNMASISIPSLDQNNITRVIFYSNLVLHDLPISITVASIPFVIGEIPKKNISSNFAYRWLEMYPLNFELPDTPITIEGNPSNSPTRIGEQEPSLQDNPRSGFGFCLLTILCLFVIANIISSRK